MILLWRNIYRRWLKEIISFRIYTSTMPCSGVSILCTVCGLSCSTHATTSSETGSLYCLSASTSCRTVVVSCPIGGADRVSVSTSCCTAGSGADTSVPLVGLLACPNQQAWLARLLALSAGRWLSLGLPCFPWGTGQLTFFNPSLAMRCRRWWCVLLHLSLGQISLEPTTMFGQAQPLIDGLIPDIFSIADACTLATVCPPQKVPAMHDSS